MTQISTTNNQNSLNDNKNSLNIDQINIDQINDDLIISEITNALENNKKYKVINILKSINNTIKINTSITQYNSLFFKVYPQIYIKATNSDFKEEKLKFIVNLITYDPFCILQLYPILPVYNWWMIAKNIFTNNKNSVNFIKNREKYAPKVQSILLHMSQIYAPDIYEEHLLSDDSINYILRDLKYHISNTDIYQRIFNVFFDHYYTWDRSVWESVEKFNLWTTKRISYHKKLSMKILSLAGSINDRAIEETNEHIRRQHINNIINILDLIDYMENVDKKLSSFYQYNFNIHNSNYLSTLIDF